MEKNPDYNYTLGMVDYLKEAKSKTRISLKLSARLQEKKKLEKERLDLENKLRKAKGLKPYKNMDQINKEKEDDTSEYKRNKPAKNDAGLIEGGNILVDYIQLQNSASHLRGTKSGMN
jgi:carboxyl-terminal processing protease